MIRQNQLLNEILKTKNSNSWVYFETKTKRKENNEKKKEMKINGNYPTLPYFYMMATLKNFFGNHWNIGRRFPLKAKVWDNFWQMRVL